MLLSFAREIHGMKRVMLTVLMLVAGCLPILGQEKPSWITRVENVLREKERAWRISEKDTRGAGRYFHETIILKAGALRADISIDVLDSTGLAKEQFAGEEIAFTNILEKDAIKSKLEGLGDENFMFTGKRGPRKHGNIFFRQGNVLVKVFAPSSEVARRFAKYVVDQLAPTNGRLQPTPR